MTMRRTAVYRLTDCLTSWVLLSTSFWNAVRLCKYSSWACSKCCWCLASHADSSSARHRTLSCFT